MTDDDSIDTQQDGTGTEQQKNGPSVENLKHVCTVCNRRFARREHLMRHGRIHTKEAPFGCDVCGQHFRRQDVFRRHLIGVCGASAQSMPNGRQRAPRACNQCRAQKLKCDGSVPCRRCASLSRPCAYRPLRNSKGITATVNIDVAGNDTVTRLVSPAFATPQPNFFSIHQRRDGNDENDGNDHTTTSPIQPAVIAAVANQHGPSPQRPQHTQHPQQDDSHLQQTEAIDMVDMDPCLPQNGLDSELVLNRSQDNTHAEAQRHDMPAFPWEALHNDVAPPFADAQLNAALDFDLLGNANDMTSYPFFLSFDSENEASVNGFPASPWLFHNICADGVSMQDTSSLILPASYTRQSRTRKELPPWLHKVPSTVHPHDPHIVRAFVEEFLVNMSHTFPTFQNLNVHGDTLPDVILAMAAVGGLFSKIDGSFRVAMSMYTDARRLASGRVWSQPCTSDSQYLDLIRAYIAIEVFGFYSGDARSMECSEACHRHLLQVLDDAGVLSSDTSMSPEGATERLELLASVYTLESYYVVLLRRAPCLYGHSLVDMFEQQPRQRASDGHFDPFQAFSNLFKSTVNPCLPIITSPSPLSTLCCLSALATLSWHARPRKPHRSSQGPLSLWSQEHVELALHRWFQSTETAVTAADPTPTHSAAALSTAILFHMTYISLYIDMDSVHQFVAAKLRSSSAKDAHDKLERISHRASKTNSRTAMLHATALLDAVKQLVVFAPYKTRTSSSSEDTPETRSTAEAPHISICIYSASVILWVASIIVQVQVQVQPDHPGDKAHLEGGIHLLSRLQSRMARKLCHTLVRLHSSPNTKKDVGPRNISSNSNV